MILLLGDYVINSIFWILTKYHKFMPIRFNFARYALSYH